MFLVHNKDRVWFAHVISDFLQGFFLNCDNMVTLAAVPLRRHVFIAAGLGLVKSGSIGEAVTGKASN
jgi:hypothetical protein